MHLLHNRGLK